jgi:hypothetical protein
MKRQAKVSAENSYICNSLMLTMRGVATLRSKHYGVYQLLAINNSGESIKNREYFPVFEAKLGKPQILLRDLEETSKKSNIRKKSKAKNLV